MLTCLQTNRVSIFEFGEHTTASSSPRRKKLSSTQKTFCRELADQHLRPLCIRNALSRKFSTPLNELPSLTTVQNFVNYYARTFLENHDCLKELREWIGEHAFNGQLQMTETFTFGFDLDAEGKPLIGNGSDEKPFIVVLTTKALMLRLMVPPDSYILHVDATYKANHCDYPVLVVGVSDRSRCFHLVARFVISQETQPILETAMLELRRLYFWIAQRELTVRYAMADADQAQYNALVAVFGGNVTFQFLMCYFHVMKNVQKALGGFPLHVVAAVTREVYDMHFARSSNEFLRLRDTVLQRWMTIPGLQGFARYMWALWLTGRFCVWQAFATPSGFATTNNPAETFNAQLKRDYTLRRRLKIGALLREFSACCEDHSSSSRPFQFTVTASSSIVRRGTDMVRANLLGFGECTDLQDEISGDLTQSGSYHYLPTAFP